MAEEYISREEAMEKLGISGHKLDELVSEGRISVAGEGEGQTLSAEDVEKVRLGMQETMAEEPELMLEETAGEPEGEEEPFFDFADELEVEPAEAEGEAEEIIPLEEAEAEGEEDILGEILDEEGAEETVSVSAPEEQTAEITQIEEETYEGEDIEEVITAEEELGGAEEAEEEFGIPYGAPVAVPPEAPVGTGTVVLLVLTLVVMAWAALVLSENILGTSSALTSWAVGAS